MTDARIAEIAGLVARRREIDASLTPDGTHSSDWYQRRRDELLWTNARLADTVPELLDALDAAAAQQAAAEHERDAAYDALETIMSFGDPDGDGDGEPGFRNVDMMSGIARDALASREQASGGTEVEEE